jgi:Zn-dependent M28 family amino/carboxypeptidase
MLGGHLDSVVDGPGINDNGSGVAALLEVARGVASIGVPDGTTVRIAFWGGEEFGLLGSGAYVRGLSASERARIVAYLNLDMVGSPNGVTFVYSDPQGPRGSGAVTIDYEVWFQQHGLPTERDALGGSSDHYWFAQNGIPTGGIFSGATEVKTVEEASVEGGTAGAATDACYHLPCDTIDNVDLHRAATAADATLAVALRLASVTH